LTISPTCPTITCYMDAGQSFVVTSTAGKDVNHTGEKKKQ
jgi:hypothetical protein